MRRALLLIGCVLSACAGSTDPSPGRDAGPADVAPAPGDAGFAAADAGEVDAGLAPDAGSAIDAGAAEDAGEMDAGSAPGRPARVLFVGNSYTFYNDLPERYAALVGEPAPTVRMVTAGGRQLWQHADDEALTTRLAEGWDVVVLQEQSQIPGFPSANPDRLRSLAAARTLAERAGPARVVLFLTWGREAGDARNPDLFPDFETMQTRLDEGYAAMQDALLNDGRDVAIAPVGPAFRAVHDTDPPLFAALYTSDGSHPSALGTDLAALVFGRVLNGLRPEETTPLEGADAARWPALVAAAAAARAP